MNVRRIALIGTSVLAVTSLVVKSTSLWAGAESRPQSDPVKKIVGPEAAGERGGMQRFTKIMFGASYIDGKPDPGTRIDPNSPSA